MQQFQLAVKDQRWKTKAIFEMIDIVLDPGNNFAMMEEENEENPECREQSKKAHQLLDQVRPWLPYILQNMLVKDLRTVGRVF